MPKVENVPVVGGLTREDVQSMSWEDQHAAVMKELRKVYRENLQPAEQDYHYDRFKPSSFQDTLACSTPIVLFIGSRTSSTLVLSRLWPSSCLA